MALHSSSSSFSSLLPLPGAFPACCHLPAPYVPSSLTPNAQNLWLEWSWAGLGGDLLGSQGGHWILPLPEKLLKPGLALEDQHQTLQKGCSSWGWKGFQGFRPHAEGSARFSSFSMPADGACARRCPALIPSLSLPMMNEPLEATGEEWSDISGGQVGLLIYFSRENILKQKV